MTSEMKRVTQAIFSVCADDTTISVATAASLNISGAVFAGEFRDYITLEKRLQHRAHPLSNAGDHRWGPYSV